MAEALNHVPGDIKETIKLPLIIRDGLKRFCDSLEYSYFHDMSDIREFCEGIHITGWAFQRVGRAPMRRHSENTRNNTRHAVQIRERSRQTRDLFTRTAQGITARLRPAHFHIAEIGGSLDTRNEVRDNHSSERNREHVLPPGVMRAHVEEHYQDVIQYHVTLSAQADRTIKVMSTRIAAAGGLGAAGGGLGGAVTGAGAGATTGGAIGMIATPVGAVIGAGIGVLIGGGIGLVVGAAGGAGAGVGIAHKQRPMTIACTAEDVFLCLDMSSNFRKQEGRVHVEITGNVTCAGSHTQTVLQELGQHQQSGDNGNQ